MLLSKRRHEGVLMIDDRASGGKLVEQAISTCKHCQRGVIRNFDRTRQRAYCRKCDHYICDACEALRVTSGYECVPFDKILDGIQERLARHG